MMVAVDRPYSGRSVAGANPLLGGAARARRETETASITGAVSLTAGHTVGIVGVDETNGDAVTASQMLVAEAAGRVSVQIGCSPHDAMIAMSARAKDDDRSIDEIATLVLDGTLRFD